MNTFEYISHLRSRDIKLTLEGDQLRLKAAPGALTPTLRKELAERKPELVAFLREAGQLTGTTQPSIPQVSRAHPLPLSPNQHRLWSLMQLTPDSPAYNMHLAVRLRGPLNVTALEQSLKALVERHEILRTTFPVNDEMPIQKIAPFQAFDLATESVEATAKEDQARQIRQIILQEAEGPYQLDRGPLLRLKLLRLSDAEHVLLIGMHHIISDGWSYTVFLRELNHLYQAYRAGRSSPELAELPIQYADYATWQQNRLNDEALAPLTAYWQEQLSGPVPPLALPTDRSIPAKRSNQAAVHTFLIPAPLTKGLKRLSQETGVTMFVTLLAAYNVWLYRHTGQEDMIVCSPVAGRDREETRNLIGYFNGLILLRTKLSETLTFRELLKQTAQVVLEAYEHQDLPFQNLSEFPNLVRTPISRGMFMLQDSFADILKLPEIETEALDLNSGTATFDFALNLEERQDTLVGRLEYKMDLFDEARISQLQQNLETILAGIIAGPDRPISGLPKFIDPAHHHIDLAQPALARNRYQVITTPSPKKKAGVGKDRPFLTPQDAVEFKLVQTWESVLGVKIASVRENFFELGGHSLLAVKLFAEIERAFNQKLPLASLFEAQTVEAMAELIRGEGWSSPWTTLIPIQPDGARPPIFFVPPLGGITVRITNLVRHLAADQPFYGLQAYGLEEGQLPHTRLEEMAAHYIGEIQSVWPDGPYILGGQCFGGSVAFEMAQQLQAQGQTVALLFMVDARPPTLTGPSEITLGDFLPNLLASAVRRPQDAGRKSKRLWRYLHKYTIRTLRRTNIHEAAFWHSPQQRRLNRVLHGHQLARHHYRARPYPGKIVSLDAAQKSDKVARRMEAEWSGLALAGAESCTVPGTHITILNEPNVQVLAEYLNEYLREVEVV
jgi:thioesterase domain-containing protein/NRPS condensation-like uncharacterized protein